MVVFQIRFSAYVKMGVGLSIADYTINMSWSRLEYQFVLYLCIAYTWRYKNTLESLGYIMKGIYSPEKY